MVRAKFQVTKVADEVYGGKEITLTPQYEALALGKFFYVDFTEVPAT